MTNADREELVRLRKEAELRACDIDAIDHYREGLYRILRGEENPREIAADYLGESL